MTESNSIPDSIESSAGLARRSFLAATVGAVGLAASKAFARDAKDPVRQYGPNAEPVRYPDPDIVTLDPRFKKYALGNTPIQRIYHSPEMLWAEGPAWNGVGKYLLWSDIPNNVQMRWLEEDGHVSTFRNPAGNSNGNTFDFQGRQISFEHGNRRVVRYEYDGSITVLADKFDGKPLNAPNDGAVHPNGDIWFTDPGYGSLIHAHLGGRWQIVGHEARSLCGWDPESGKRLWQVVPKEPHDFNVPTPSRVGDLLLAATENNGTRLYAFDGAGVIRPEPVFSSGALSPQIATPVRVGTRLWGQDGEGVHALALDRALRPVGVWADPAFKDHVSLVAGGSRVLAVAKTGDIFLFSADAAGAGVVKGANVFEKHPGGAATEVWSFPVVLNGCLYLRSQDEVVCLEL